MSDRRTRRCFISQSRAGTRSLIQWQGNCKRITCAKKKSITRATTDRSIGPLDRVRERRRVFGLHAPYCLFAGETYPGLQGHIYAGPCTLPLLVGEG